MFTLDIRNNDILAAPIKARGPKRRDRAAQSAARQAGTVANQTAGNYGAQAGSIGSTLTPFLTEQMKSPLGMSQRDMTAIQTNALAGAGGATSGLTGAASKMGATTRNPMGFSSALDAAAREKAKAAASAGSGAAVENAKVKLGQSSDAAKELGSLYGTDVEGQLKGEGLSTDDINALTAAGKSGWLQNMDSTIEAVTGAGNSAANIKKAFG